MSNPLDSAPGSELFGSYEADFAVVQADISQKLDTIPDLTGESKKAALRAAERAVDEADEIIGQMRIEIQNIPSNARAPIQTRLRNYATDLDKSRRELKKAAADAERQQLFGNRGGSGPGGFDAVQDQRQQLLSGTQRLERTSERLTRSQQIANETENVGSSILSNLYVQREQLQNTQDTLIQGEGYINKSVQTLRGMARRMATNRLITIAIITVLVLLIIMVIVNKFR